MHEDDMKCMQSVEEILEKELRAEMKKIVDAGAFAPGQSKTLCEAVDLMLKMNEYEDRNMGMMEGYSERRGRSPMTGRYVSRDYRDGSYDPYTMRGGYNVGGSYGGVGYVRGSYDDPYNGGSYGMGYSGHSINDRMIAALEGMVDNAKSDYEKQEIINAIHKLQNR
jgi:hypothetical protein